MKPYNVLLVCLILSFVSKGQDIQSILQHRDIVHASVGVSVRDISTQQEVFSHNSKKLLSPASTLKVLTNIVGLSVLGEGFRFKTQLGYTGTLERDGTLEGNLIIKGGGDPTFGSKRWKGRDTDHILNFIASIIQKAGITCINGAVLVDDSYFKGQNIPDQWKWYDLGNYYASGAWALNVNENLYHIYFDKNIPEGQQATVHHIRPDLSQLTLTSEVKIAPKGTGDNAYIYGAPFQQNRIIRGTIPFSIKYFDIKGSLPNPPLAFAELLTQRLSEQSIKVFKGYGVKENTQQLTTLHTYTSPPLSKIVQLANYKSINLYCDAILRALGKQNGGNGSIDAGIQTIEHWLTKHGYSLDEVVLKDGSGLAPSDKITPALLSSLLAKYGSSFSKNYLPQVGKEGTVKNLLKNSALAKDFRLKSGSYEGVIAYTGYITGKSKQRYSISIIINNHTASYSTMKRHVESMLTEIHETL